MTSLTLNKSMVDLMASKTKIDLNGMVLYCGVKNKPLAFISLDTILTYGGVPLMCTVCGFQHTYSISNGRLKVKTSGMD